MCMFVFCSLRVRVCVCMYFVYRSCLYVYVCILFTDGACMCMFVFCSLKLRVCVCLYCVY